MLWEFLLVHCRKVSANTTRSAIVAEAQKWVNVTTDGSANHHALIDYYNSQLSAHPEYKNSDCNFASYSTPWCAIFVSVVAMKCNATDVVFPNNYAEVDRYQANGTWVENDAYVPKAGDLVFFDWEASGSGDWTAAHPAHVEDSFLLIGNIFVALLFLGMVIMNNL